MDLLQSSAAHLSGCRSLWVTPAPHESGAPDRRIVHSREVRLPAPAQLQRLGVRLSRGYMKCGSTAELEKEWIVAATVRVSHGGEWQTALQLRDLPRPADAEAVQWFDLGGQVAGAVLLELRRAGVEEWWPGWDVAMNGAVLEGEWLTDAPAAPVETTLALAGWDLSGQPEGVRGERRGDEVRFRTRYLEAGFDLRQARLTYLAWDSDGLGRTQRNVAKLDRWELTPPHLLDYLAQGPRLHPLGQAAAAGALHHGATGTVTVAHNTLTYDLALGDTGQRYTLAWEAQEDRLVLRAERTGERPLRAWTSGAWHFAFDSRVIPVQALGRITRFGETGLMELPLRLHGAGLGTVRVTALGDACLWRSDSVRPSLSATTGELKLGEAPQPEGDYHLPAGRYAAEVTFAVEATAPTWRDARVPQAVERAVQRHRLSALTYRADTATFSNNSNAVHFYGCLENWSTLAVRAGEITPGLTGLDLLRDTLEHWLDDAPAYGSGRSSLASHRYEDEYLQVSAAALVGAARYLAASGDAAWAARYSGPLGREIARLRARDLDGDGLLESPYRLGISGGHQWSTNWYDVVSFGWKCAFSNAYLYAALTELDAALPAVGQAALAEGLAAWAAQAQANYTPTFLNPQTGWLAGWRCRADQLHDAAFLAINGLAVTVGVLAPDLAERIMRALWAELARVGFRDFRLGVPTCLWPIPYSDMGLYQTGRPFGHYQNGGVTHSQAAHFVNGLYRVGMTAEGDEVLHGLCAGMADDSAFAGVDGAGIDWRRWDGAPSGYEGLLTDQFGFLATAIDRYGLSASGPQPR
ncbi:MAG: hypothetical protein IT317_21935 [Anaerolineales bacterium]|nr:hypothetical protein [Anaerolineales bacterium]